MLQNLESSKLPLFRGFEPTDIVLWRGEIGVSLQELHAEAHSVAQALPDTKYVINMCHRQDTFLVGLIAAQIKSQVSIFPNSQVPSRIEQIAGIYPDSFIISDGKLPYLAENLISLLDIISHAPPISTRIPIENETSSYTAILFTSGTTGTPNAHIKTFGSLVHVAKSTAESLQLNQTLRYNYVATVPAQHMYGLEVGIMLPLQTGSTFYFKRPYYPKDVQKALSHIPPPRVFVTTPHYLDILVKAKLPLPDLEMVISATDHLSFDLARKAETQFNTKVLEIYGCTEAGSLAVRRTSDGKLWHLLDDVRILRDGERCVVQAPYLPETIPLMDSIELQSEKTFLLGDRLSSMIRIAGKRESLGNLNYHLNKIPGVQEGCFIQQRSDYRKLGRLEAVVVAPNVAPSTIIEALSHRLDTAFIPRRIYFIDSLPMNETGKISRDELIKLINSAP